MSSSPIGTYAVPQPPEDTYPATLPAGIEPASSSSSSSSTSTSSTASSSGTSSASSSTGSENPYAAAYATLISMDTQELLNVSFGTQENAQSNILSVLSQWASIQAQEQAAQEQAIQSASSAAGSSSNSGPDIPSLSDLIAQSDQEANTALSNYANAPAGSSIVDYQA